MIADKVKFILVKHGKQLLCINVFLFSCLFAVGASQDSIEQVLTNYFQELGKTPQEKLSLHLDKSVFTGHFTGSAPDTPGQK